MKKLTTSVLAVVLTGSFALVNAQKKDTIRTQNIGEVIITGALGIKKIADATTSSQQVVTTEQLNQAGNPNAVQALVGKVSGLQINQTNSSVNSSNSIQLRGIRTITGNNDALIVIDNAISTANVLQGLPPNIIETVNVIKGAQGAALYGSDGVNGVIIVTTKKGAKNKLSVSYEGTVDFETVAFIPKRQTKYGQGWYNDRDQYENGAWGPAYDGSLTSYGLPLYDYDGDGLITLDGIGWGAGTLTSGDNPATIIRNYVSRPNEVKDFFQTGVTRNNTITLNAGSEDKYALLSLNNTTRDFVIDGDKSTKTSFLFKGGAKVGNFSFDGGINYIRTDFSQTTTMFDETNNDSLFWTLLQSASDIPITAYKDYADNGYAWNIYYQNPYWRMKHARQNYKKDFFSATLGAGYKVNDHINLSYSGNLKGNFINSTKYRDAYSVDKLDGPAGPPNIAGISSALFLSDANSFDYYGDLLVNFDYDLTKDINAKLNIGHNYQENRYELMQNGGLNLTIPGIYVMTNVTQPLPSGSAAFDQNGKFRKNKHSVFANLDLAYKNFLFVNATARNEWASVLPTQNNSYFYPSVGVSFVPTKAFDFGGDTLNYMKVSANYSKVGNSSNINWYDTNRTSELVAGFPFDGVNSYRNGMVQTDPNIRPEFVTSTEINLDLGMFRDRITLSGSLYKQDTKDLITNQTISNASGINALRANIGDMESKGAEVNLGLVPIRTSDFRWELNAGYSYTESRITDLQGGADEISLVSGSEWGIFAQKGSLFPLIKTTMMQRDDQGRIIIDPTTGNPLITATLENAGSAVPKSIYNFSTKISFKGFKLAATADYRYGAKFIADNIAGLAFNGALYDSALHPREDGGYIMPNSVIPDGSGGYIANTSVKTGGDTYNSVVNYYSNKYATYGENLLKGGAAFKIREIALSYTLPGDFIRPYGLQEVTLGVHARNPFQKFADDNLNYADPESSYYSGNARGIANRSQYPSTKIYGFSLNLKF